MIRRSQIFLFLLFLQDLLLIALGWLLAYQLRFVHLSFIPTSHTPQLEQYLQILPMLLLIAGITLPAMGMYRDLLKSSHEYLTTLKTLLILFVLFIGSLFFYRGFSFSRIMMVYFAITTVPLVMIGRFAARLFVIWVRNRGYYIENSLLIGSGNTAEKFAQMIQQHKYFGIKLYGYVSPKPVPNLLDLPYLGTYTELHTLIANHDISKVYIALESQEMSDLACLNTILAKEVVDLFMVPDIHHSLNINPQIMDLDGMPLIAMRQSPLSGWNQALKRAMDIIGAMAALILFSIPMILTALLVKLTSPGPLLYRQERMGLDGIKFNILKFRSMRVDAEQKSGAIWATKEDDRTTQIGKFIRKFSLDELPQLFNVLAGSMSLVGPRPERPVFIDEFKSQIPNYMLRHKMKAGITGWAQVNGWRGNTSLEKRIECDIFYLTNWSIWLDIKILFMTLYLGFYHPNAY